MRQINRTPSWWTEFQLGHTLSWRQGIVALLWIQHTTFSKNVCGLPPHWIWSDAMGHGSVCLRHGVPGVVRSVSMLKEVTRFSLLWLNYKSMACLLSICLLPNWSSPSCLVKVVAQPGPKCQMPSVLQCMRPVKGNLHASWMVMKLNPLSKFKPMKWI